MLNLVDTFDAVRDGVASFGVIPIENSTNGSVTMSLDLFRSEQTVLVYAETFVAVRHCILGRNREFSQIERIYSHPQVTIRSLSAQVTNSRRLVNAKYISISTSKESSVSMSLLQAEQPNSPNLTYIASQFRAKSALLYTIFH